MYYSIREHSDTMAFVTVGSKQDFPEGSGRVVKVNGKEIAVFNRGGEFHAIDNTCAHLGGPLGEGMLKGDVVSCPWHGWQFDIKTGISPVNPAAKVASYEVRAEGEAVTVSTEPKR
jgi:nitrite reductase (NADH) small subunit